MELKTVLKGVLSTWSMSVAARSTCKVSGMAQENRHSQSKGSFRCCTVELHLFVSGPTHSPTEDWPATAISSMKFRFFFFPSFTTSHNSASLPKPAVCIQADDGSFLSQLISILHLSLATDGQFSAKSKCCGLGVPLNSTVIHQAPGAGYAHDSTRVQCSVGC